MTADRAAALRQQALVDEIVHAVRAAAVRAVQQGAAIDTAIARAVARQIGDAAGDGVAHRERPAERRRRENAAALQQMAELEQEGRGRAAARIVARRMAANPRDPLEVEILAQRFRRLRRNEQCADGPPDQA